MTRKEVLGLKTEEGVILFVVVVLIIQGGAQERNLALRAPGGSLLCPLVEDFYSYKISSTYGPSRWGEISKCCEGQRQSPRDLSSHSTSICGQGQGMSFYYDGTTILSGKLFNNGHDPTVALHISNTTCLFNAPFTNEPYILDNIHLHFCTEHPNGSEHTIDGKFYLGEIHLVHFKASYGSLERAVLYEDGLVVVGIMMQLVSINNWSLNQEMAKIIRRIGDLRGVGKEYQLPVQVNVAEIFPRSQAFFTYAGSMTSPPCSESVRWVVLKEPINVSTREMEILARLPNKERSFTTQACNDRPLQVGNTPIATNFACTSNIAGEELNTPFPFS